MEASAAPGTLEPFPAPEEPSLADRRPVAWSAAKRLGFRFLAVYFVLWTLPFPLSLLPWAGGPVSRAVDRVESSAAQWVGTHVLRLGGEMMTDFTGSGDREVDYARLVIPYGDFSPMGVLWSFMGSALAYTVFAGLGECLGALLVLVPRTRTLGALVLVGVLANVAMLNYAYDVPVKLFSTQLLLIAVGLLLVDGRRLFALFVANRPVPAVERLLPLHLGSSDAPGFVSIQHMDGSLSRHRAVLDTEARTLTFLPEGQASVEAARAAGVEVTDVLRYERPAPDLLVLRGAWQGARIEVRLHRRDLSEMELTGRGFHWINDRPYNR